MSWHKKILDKIFIKFVQSGVSILCICTVFVFFFCFICHIYPPFESELYRYTLDGKSALAWELPFSRFMGHLSST